VWCRAVDTAGRESITELETAGGYTFTARAAVAAVQAVLGGAADLRPGFQTPSLAFGSNFVDRVEGTRWIRGGVNAS
jgi:short subunit dehydrogenase-like uncharacterized protein